MNDFDRKIIGVTSQEDLVSLRDLMQEIATGQAVLVGRFSEHAEHEAHWQDQMTERVDAWMLGESERIAKAIDPKLDSCRAASAKELAATVASAREYNAERRDALAVKTWLSDRSKRLAASVGAAIFLVATALLVMHNLDHAAIVTSMASAFAAWSATFIFRRH